ncbi:MAG: right-handed parallel beta-helix repeat-containing protein [Actinobacteria bacterium]|nr:right-handed parallel beta-helix repeat-containing protein [Actinomycetota bacterium]
MLRKCRRTVIALAALACALIALCLPAFASAAGSQTFTVNGIGDTATKANCEAGTGECTLRGAIEAANATTDQDTIHFASNPFDGESGLSTIVLGSALPTITEPVEIDAGKCHSFHYNVEGPCAEVDGSGLGAESDFTVEAHFSSVNGIAVNGGENGIALRVGTEMFRAENDWFGVQLGGFSGGASANAGVLVEPGAKVGIIGGEALAQRDVFEESPVGVEIRGAAQNQVQGNLIGLKPDGGYSSSRSVGVGVRIVDSTAPAGKAEFNLIGGEREGGANSERCSGACNVFATESGPGIELESATGPTFISANYFGLEPDGATKIQSLSSDWILAKPSGPGKPGPGEVAIGGPTPATEGNLFVEGENGVKAEGAKDLEVLGNAFGFTSDGEAIEDGRARQDAISVSSEGLTEGAAIESNAINAEMSGGIKSLFAGSEIVRNDIVGGGPAILTAEPDGGVGNLIRGNMLTEPSTAGISVENSANVVSANTIAKSAGTGIEVEKDGPAAPPFADESNVVIGNTITEAGGIGIEIGSNATHNRVGGDAPGEANTITKSGGAGERDGAITIVSRTEGRNEVAANTGFGNSPRFIKLISHGGPEKPNGGIKPPAFATVLQSSAKGTAEPNATVRIFSKASAETGELGALLKVVKADAAGNWSATYATVPVGTLVTATQTSSERATSELTTAVAAGADPSSGGGSSGSGSTSSPPPPPPPAPPKAPKVKITAGPKKSSTATTAKFKFKAQPAAGAKFECKLDNAKWARCSSPKTYKQLKVGKHTFRVRAIASGKTSAAAIFKFTIKE